MKLDLTLHTRAQRGKREDVAVFTSLHFFFHAISGEEAFDDKLQGRARVLASPDPFRVALSWRRSLFCHRGLVVERLPASCAHDHVWYFVGGFVDCFYTPMGLHFASRTFPPVSARATIGWFCHRGYILVVCDCIEVVHVSLVCSRSFVRTRKDL